MPHIDETIAFQPVGFAVIVVSDTRDASTDKSGNLLEERIFASGHRLVFRTIVKDDRDAIRNAVMKAVDDANVDAIITSGGTGFTGRDVTPETIEPMFDKRMDGFSAIFHKLSYDIIGTSTIQSRCTAGLIAATYTFVLPGSPGACRDAWDKILRDQFDIRFRPCNFTEIMPRLRER